MVIWNAFCSRQFKTKGGFVAGFDYNENKNAWMMSDLFSNGLRRFDNYIGRKGERNTSFLVENCSAHATSKTIIHLRKV